MRLKIILIGLAFFSIFFLINQVQAAEVPVKNSTEISEPITISDEHPYNQIFTIQAGPFHPTSISLSNSNFKYDYTGDSLHSYLVEPGWNLKLFHFLGAVYIQENLALSSFKASLPTQGGNLSLFMMGVDIRVRHAWEWFPLRAVIPFIEGGYQYTFYMQSGPSDFESTQGSVGNIVAGGGIDFWLNAVFSKSEDHVNKYNFTPVFLTAKVNYIAPKSSDVNLGSTTFLAGLSIGI